MVNNEPLPYYPPQLKEFVTHNRADEITKALNYLKDHRILLISGMGGVGKTTLARSLIEIRPANVPLPFWFAFVRNMDATLGDVLERLAGYINAPGIAGFKPEKREAGLDDINKLIVELQRREQLWLIFDGIDVVLDDRYFHDLGMDLLFTSLRESTHNAKIIVTSRILPLLRNGDSLIDIIYELKGLNINSAVDFLIQNGLDGIERKKLEELATGVDGHPLALRLLIELVKNFGVSDMLKDLDMFQERKEDTIKKARRLFEKLAGDEKELLERISVFRQPEPMTAIEKMFTERTSEDVVERLIDKSLLETDHKGDYWLHPMIRGFSYDDLKNKIEIHKLACSYYLTLPLPEKRTKKDDVQSLIEAQYHASMAKEYDQAASIIFDKNLYEDLDRWGEYKTLIELYSGVLPKDGEESLLSDKQTYSNVIGNLGSAYSALGQVKKAIELYEKALEIAQEIGDRKKEGTWLRNLGLAYGDLGWVEKAIKYYQKALDIATEIGDKRGEGNALGNLGLARYHLDQVDKAIESYEKALDIAQEIGDKRGEGNVLGNLGLAYYSLGQVDKAIESYEQALDIATEIGDKRGEGNALGNLGLARYHLDQVDKAIESYEKALDIAQEIGDKRGEGNVLGNLGLARYRLGQVDKAIEFHEKALAIAQEIGDKRGEGNVLGNLGNAYSLLGQVEKAIQSYEKALAIAQEIGERRGEGAALGNLGNAYSLLGLVEKAIQYYEQALAIARETGDRTGEGNALGNLGIAYSNLGQVEKAIQYYEQALAIATEIGYRRGESAGMGNLGWVYSQLGQVEKAIEYFKKALDIEKKIGDRRGEGDQLNNLGYAFQKEKNHREALACYLLAKEIQTEIKDPNLKFTESNLSNLKAALGDNEFKKLVIEVEPAAEEIVRKMLE